MAAFLEGRHAQAFPSFGSERMGAPVVSFCRIASQAIRSREPVSKPNALVIQDATLLHSVDVFSGLDSAGFMLINSTRSFEELGIAEFVARFPPGHVVDIGATELARQMTGKPMPNSPLLGGLAAVSGQLHCESVMEAVQQKFPGSKGEQNAAAVKAAFELALDAVKEQRHASAG